MLLWTLAHVAHCEKHTIYRGQWLQNTNKIWNSLVTKWKHGPFAMCPTGAAVWIPTASAAQVKVLWPRTNFPELFCKISWLSWPFSQQAGVNTTTTTIPPSTLLVGGLRIKWPLENDVTSQFWRSNYGKMFWKCKILILYSPKVIKHNFSGREKKTNPIFGRLITGCLLKMNYLSLLNYNDF